MVAATAQSNQINFGVAAGMTARCFMVNLKIFHPAAELAAPPISLQHLSTEPTVGICVQSEGRLF